MNAPRDLGPDFRSWLRDTPPMPPELPKRTLDEAKQTRRRRRWLWFLPGPKPTAGADDQDDRTRPPASTETTHIGGTTTMLSPAKLIAAMATVALAGTLLLVLPADQDEAPAQAEAPTHITEIAEVEGQLVIQSHDERGEIATYDWGQVTRDELWTGLYDLDDDRIDGNGRARVNADHVRNVGGPKSITYFIENDGGSWVGSGHGWGDVGKGGGHHRLVLSGQGGYEGLTAILTLDQAHVSPTLTVAGVVFDGELPPVPGPAPTEFE